jgi:hypothetical protein
VLLDSRCFLLPFLCATAAAAAAADLLDSGLSCTASPLPPALLLLLLTAPTAFVQLLLRLLVMLDERGRCG